MFILFECYQWLAASLNTKCSCLLHSPPSPAFFLWSFILCFLNTLKQYTYPVFSKCIYLCVCVCWNVSLSLFVLCIIYFGTEKKKHGRVYVVCLHMLMAKTHTHIFRCSLEYFCFFLLSSIFYTIFYGQ